MKPKAFKTGLVLSLMVCGGLSAQNTQYEEGKHFVRLPMVFEQTREATSEDAKESIQVVEFFSYRCLHCYRLESFIDDWLKSKDSDVSFRREHVSWTSSETTLARAFYIARDLDAKAFSKIHKAMFEAIHEKGMQLAQERLLTILFDNAADIDPDTFKEKFWSDEIQAKMRDVNRKVRVWRITNYGTPCIVVGGKYLVGVTGEIRKHDQIFPVVDFLVEKIRSEDSSFLGTVRDAQN